MSEITEYAYTQIRGFIETNWKYIELQDEAGGKIVRLTSTDPRVTIVAEGKNIKITVTVKGSDADITAPKTFAKSVIYDGNLSTDKISTESFTPFTIEGNQDELTVQHTIQIPQVI